MNKFLSLYLKNIHKLIMQSLQEQVRELCQLSIEVIGNPILSPSDAAKKLGLSPETIKVAVSGAFLVYSLVYSPLIGTSLYIWRKYTASQKRKQEKERMIQEIIAKQQAIIRKLEAEGTRMKQENAQNQIEVENLKKMLHILEQAVKQVKTSA
ncbi:MAG: hypothetical protein ACTTI8_00015 [Prevotella intermedia]